MGFECVAIALIPPDYAAVRQAPCRHSFRHGISATFERMTQHVVLRGLRGNPPPLHTRMYLSFQLTCDGQRTPANPANCRFDVQTQRFTLRGPMPRSPARTPRTPAIRAARLRPESFTATSRPRVDTMSVSSVFRTFITSPGSPPSSMPPAGRASPHTCRGIAGQPSPASQNDRPRQVKHDLRIARRATSPRCDSIGNNCCDLRVYLRIKTPRPNIVQSSVSEDPVWLPQNLGVHDFTV